MKDIDEEVVDQLIQISSEVEGSNLFEELVGLFKSETPSRVNEMRNAFKDKDYETLHRAAHSLKSGSAYLGASKISNISKLIELDSSDLALKEDVEKLLLEIEDSYTVAIDYLTSKLAA